MEGIGAFIVSVLTGVLFFGFIIGTIWGLYWLIKKAFIKKKEPTNEEEEKIVEELAKIRREKIAGLVRKGYNRKKIKKILRNEAWSVEQVNESIKIYEILKSERRELNNGKRRIKKGNKESLPTKRGKSKQGKGRTSRGASRKK